MPTFTITRILIVIECPALFSPSLESSKDTASRVKEHMVCFSRHPDGREHIRWLFFGDEKKDSPSKTSFASMVTLWHGLCSHGVRNPYTASAKPKVAAETVALIQEMASTNRLWGAERIRGELLKLGLRVCKRTIQKYMRPLRRARPRGQNWSTFLHTHAEHIWACDFLPVTDLFFRSLFAFFIIELHSRRVVHVGVHNLPRCPTDAWTARTSAGSHGIWRGTKIPHP